MVLDICFIQASCEALEELGNSSIAHDTLKETSLQFPFLDELSIGSYHRFYPHPHD